MIAVTNVALGALGLAGLLCVVRLLRRGSLADRIVALDTLLVVAVMAIAVLGVRAASEAFVHVVLIVALLAFVGTITVARFLERRGA